MAPEIYSSVEDAKLVEKRRDQFVPAAAQLFAQRGFHATTIKEIAKKAEVSAGLIYAYVKTKEDVLFLVLRDVLHKLTARVVEATSQTDDPVHRLMLVVRALAEAVAEMPDLAALLYREFPSLETDQQAAIQQIELELVQYIRQCIEQGSEQGDFDCAKPELLAYQILLGAQGWALKGWRLHQISTLEDYIRTEQAMVLKFILTQNGRKHLGKLELGIELNV